MFYDCKVYRLLFYHEVCASCSERHTAIQEPGVFFDIYLGLVNDETALDTNAFDMNELP